MRVEEIQAFYKTQCTELEVEMQAKRKKERKKESGEVNGGKIKT